MAKIIHVFVLAYVLCVYNVIYSDIADTVETPSINVDPSGYNYDTAVEQYNQTMQDYEARLQALQKDVNNATSPESIAALNKQIEALQAEKDAVSSGHAQSLDNMIALPTAHQASDASLFQRVINWIKSLFNQTSAQRIAEELLQEPAQKPSNNRLDNLLNQSRLIPLLRDLTIEERIEVLNYFMMHEIAELKASYSNNPDALSSEIQTLATIVSQKYNALVQPGDNMIFWDDGKEEFVKSSETKPYNN